MWGSSILRLRQRETTLLSRLAGLTLLMLALISCPDDEEPEEGGGGSDRTLYSDAATFCISGDIDGNGNYRITIEAKANFEQVMVYLRSGTSETAHSQTPSPGMSLDHGDTLDLSGSLTDVDRISIDAIYRDTNTLVTEYAYFR